MNPCFELPAVYEKCASRASQRGPSTSRVSRRLQLLCLGLNPSLDPLPNTAIGAILAELFKSLNLSLDLSNLFRGQHSRIPFFGEVYAAAQKCSILNSPFSRVSIALGIPTKGSSALCGETAVGQKSLLPENAYLNGDGKLDLAVSNPHIVSDPSGNHRVHGQWGWNLPGSHGSVHNSRLITWR